MYRYIVFFIDEIENKFVFIIEVFELIFYVIIFVYYDLDIFDYLYNYMIL